MEYKTQFNMTLLLTVLKKSLYSIALILNTINLFLQVFFTISYSDLECGMFYKKKVQFEKRMI